MPKFQIPTLRSISRLLLVGITGFNFIASWRRHGPGTVGYGVIFALVLISTLAFKFLFTDKR